MEDDVTPYRVWWDDESGIARAEWRPGAVCGIDEARGVDAWAASLGHGRVPVLVNIREVASIDRAARQHFMNDNANSYTGVALLAGSPATRMMANFFLGIKRGDNLIKMFTQEADAIAWLQTLR